MEELIFFGVIILFSILESIARSRRQRKAGEGRESPFPGLPDPSEWEARLPEPELPTYDEEPPYDAEPSYDDGIHGDRSGPWRPTPGESPLGRAATGTGAEALPGSAARPGPGPRPSSEEMLPGDLLEELSRLAGRVQERKARTLRVPTESPPLPAPTAPSRRIPDRARAVPTRAVTAEHRIHRAHAGFGTDPSSRARSLQDDLDPLAERLSAEASAVHQQLRSRDPSALRRAVILREVLGPPVAMRE